MFRFKQLTALCVLLCAIGLHAVALADSTAEYSYETIQTKAKLLQNYALETIQRLSQQRADTASLPEPTHVALGIFPLKSSVLTPGTVTPEPMSLPSLRQPIFIVGSDTLSQTWLQKNLNQLTALHAVGFLVQADNEEDFTSMQQLADGLPLLPINADALATRWGLKHYPVLVTARGVGVE